MGYHSKKRQGRGIVMRQVLLTTFAILMTATVLTACSNQEFGTIGGAVAGGYAGSALTGGSTGGTIAGSIGGGYLGNQLTR